MKSSLTFTCLVLLSLALAYFLAWPVPVDPVAWEPSTDPGYVGDFAVNTKLNEAQYIDLPVGEYGPEDLVVGPDDHLYTAVHSGKILRLNLRTQKFDVFAQTQGRPLGLEFAADGTLWVADAYRGLLSVSPSGTVTTRAAETESGSPILFADDVAIAPDGKVYFSDASMRFSAEAVGSTLAASLLDLMEHSATGRVLVFDPATEQTRVFAGGLSFANGVAVSADGSAVFVNETGAYAVHRYSLLPEDRAARTTVLEGLPGFPDNINRMADGSLWLGVVSPRSAAMDKASGRPFLRTVMMRLPAALRPGPVAYGFVLRIDESGQVTRNLQDPAGDYASTTGAVVLPDGRLAVSSLTEPRIAVLAQGAAN